MFVRLKVLKGTCQAGKKKLTAKRYLIGQSEDCHIRPLGDGISPMHCEIVVTSLGAKITDLDSTTGTRLNGTAVDGSLDLDSGDVVHVGDVEFMVLLVREEEAEQQPVTKEERAVTDWIEEADEQARKDRMSDPAKRKFQVGPQVAEAETVEEKIDPKQELLNRLKDERKSKKPPQKLPAQDLVTDSSVSAAEEVLKQIMTTKKPGG